MKRFSDILKEMTTTASVDIVDKKLANSPATRTALKMKQRKAKRKSKAKK